jgi:hypothetical protein
MESRSPNGRRNAAVLASVLLASVAVVVVLQFAATPKAGRASPPPAAPQASVPANPHRLVTNNLKIGDTLHLDLLTVPQTVAWFLASSNTGPSYIGPYLTGLGPDWFILSGPVSLGGATQAHLDVPIPYLPGVLGLEFAIQCAVLSLSSSTVGFSNANTLRANECWGKHVLMLRQTGQTPGMTTAAQQADSLAVALQTFGNQVTVVDDVLPMSLLDYDCILDLRFTSAPAFDEGPRYIQFLRSCGGVFFVCGPYAGNPGGQMRVSWLNSFLNANLGVGVATTSGGNLAGGSIETIDTSSDPTFLTNPLTIGGLPFDVAHEGGTFGPPGAASGTAWLVGSTAFGPQVYGIFFDWWAMTGATVGGRVGVLFAGGESTFIPTAASPWPELVMDNVVWYLDR